MRDDARSRRAVRKLRRLTAPPYAARFRPAPADSFSAYDLIWVFELWALTCVPYAYWPRVVWDKDTLMGASYRHGPSRNHRLMARWVAMYEHRALTRVRHAFLSLPGDAAQLGLPNVTVLPNGYEPSRAAPRAGAREPAPDARLGFVGLLSHEPNRRGILWFAQHVLPEIRRSEGLTATELWIAGHGLPERDALTLREAPGVRLKGYVNNLDAFYGAVDVVVAPLLHGQGSSTKVFEALAHHVPVVGTPVGLRGVHPDLRSHCFEVSSDHWAACIREAMRTRDALLDPARYELHTWSALFQRHADPILRVPA